MRQRSPVAYFAILFAVVYAGLAFPWPSWQAAYSAAYRRAANALFDPFGLRAQNQAGKEVKLGRVEFRPAAKPDRTSDTDIWTRLRHSPDVGSALHSPHLTGYVPTVEFIALALATPIVWRRRLIGLVLGLVIIHAFIYLRLWIALMYYFATPGTQWQMYALSRNTLRVLDVCHEVINIAPVTSFVFPALVWLVLLFRPADWGTTFSALVGAGDELDDAGAVKTAEE